MNDTFVSLSDSYRWCAPEIFKIQGAVSAKSDIYSFGMTILEVGPNVLTFDSGLTFV